MAITYENLKGRKFFLCKGVTKTGKARYYFSREQKGDPVDEIPAGYEITESVNGVVSLSKVRPKELLDDEISTVKAAMEKHPEGHRYRVDIKSKVITIYEPVGADLRDMVAMFSGRLGFPGMIPEDFSERLEKEHNIYPQYTPVMRFTLVDRDRRFFRAERMCYLGSEDGWITFDYYKTIVELSAEAIPTLGTDEFFELW